MAEFFHMGGYASYVWSCYGLTAVVLVGNLWIARRELQSQIQRATRRNIASNSTPAAAASAP